MKFSVSIAGGEESEEALISSPRKSGGPSPLATEMSLSGRVLDIGNGMIFPLMRAIRAILVF